MNDARNRALTIEHEGRELRVYPDSEGHPTIGIGFNLDAPSARKICQRHGIDYDAIRAGQPITEAQCDAIFDDFYERVALQARKTFPDIDSWPPDAAAVVCDLIFQMGLLGFLSFHNTIACFRAHDWKGAAAGILDSVMAHQTPKRAAENAALLEAIRS